MSDPTNPFQDHREVMIDTSTEAVDLHLNQSAAAGPMADPAYTDNAGISIRTGWMRRNDALMRALAAERDALQTARDGHVNSMAQNLDAQLRAVLAERDAAQTKAARLIEALKDADKAMAYEQWATSHRARLAISAALAQKDAGNE